jgi:glycosyltransferase involved in cell wall biosynthesis
MESDISNIKVSIVISTIRPEKTLVLLASIYRQMISSGDEIILIFDLDMDDETKSLFKVFEQTLDISTIYNNKNLGLSHNRNLGMKLARNNFVIFFDDDTIIRESVIETYKKNFKQNYQAIGGPLILSSFYPKLPMWLPKGLSSLFGIHTVQKRIWGGNLGIDLKFLKKHDISFQENLGRKGEGLQSGDESNVLEKISNKNGKAVFDTNLAIYHCIDKNRYRVSYLIRRAFWQGISEVRKQTILQGIKKDFNRSIQVDVNGSFLVKLVQYLMGMLFFGTFLTGVLFELVALNWRKHD